MMNKIPITIATISQYTIPEMILSLRKAGERIAANSVVAVLYHANKNMILSYPVVIFLYFFSN